MVSFAIVFLFSFSGSVVYGLSLFFHLTRSLSLSVVGYMIYRYMIYSFFDWFLILSTSLPRSAILFHNLCACIIDAIRGFACQAHSFFLNDFYRSTVSAFSSLFCLFLFLLFFLVDAHRRDNNQHVQYCPNSTFCPSLFAELSPVSRRFEN